MIKQCTLNTVLQALNVHFSGQIYFKRLSDFCFSCLSLRGQKNMMLRYKRPQNIMVMSLRHCWDPIKPHLRHCWDPIKLVFCIPSSKVTDQKKMVTKRKYTFFVIRLELISTGIMHEVWHCIVSHYTSMLYIYSFSVKENGSGNHSLSSWFSLTA